MLTIKCSNAQTGRDTALAPIQFKNPGIVSISLIFLMLTVVSLLTMEKEIADEAGEDA